jgi:hypothetical protein
MVLTQEDAMKLTKSAVESLPAPARGYSLHWDGELKGFGMRVTARGVKTFILQRRVNGKERRITIGRLGPLTAEQARREATKLLGAIATGRDPVAERKQAEVEAVTLGETFTEYMGARGDLRPNTVKAYQRVMGLSFGDWRKQPLVEITGDMVGNRHAVLGKRYGKAQANLSMRVLGALSNFARRTTRWAVRRWSWTIRSSACRGPAPGSASTAARRCSSRISCGPG